MLNKTTCESMIYPSHGGTEGIAFCLVTEERLLRKGFKIFLRWNEEDGDYKL